MAWAAVIAGGAAIIGGAISADASRKAGNAQRGATDAGISEQQRQFDMVYGDQAPYRAAGVDALGKLRAELDRQPTAEEVMAQPGYQFGQRQGQLGLDRKIAAMGGRVSGRALKAASQFNTDYATTGYSAEYQRRQDRLNRLASLAGLGQTSTQASAAAGANSSNAISNMLTSQGNATGAGQIARGNIWGNTVNQLGAIYGRTGTGSGGQSYGSAGLDNFYFGNGTSGD